MSFKLGKIKSIAPFLTSHTKKLLINALVMPYFHYCFLAWASALSFRLKKVNEKVADALSFLSDGANYTIFDLVNRDIALFTFKALNKIAPNYLCFRISMAKKLPL